MNKEIRKKIENAFYSYKNYINQGVKSIIDWAESGITANYQKLAVQSSSDNKKENRLCQIIDDELKVYKWCRVVENTLTKYHGEHKDKLIEFLYFNHYTINKTAYLLHVGRPTVFRWKDEVLLTAEQWAQEYKLL